MSGITGKNFQISIFGESHGEALGITLNGLPAGFKLDMDLVKKEMARRAPGKNEFSTKRKEKDEAEIISGFFEGKTTGSPLTALIKNTNTVSKDYSSIKTKPRPSHADYPASIKYAGSNDYRGGGHFSGRITAAIVFAGAVAKQLLMQNEIYIASHILSIENIKDQAFDYANIERESLEELLEMDFPVISAEKGEQMKQAILAAKEEGDSVGGIVETVILNKIVGIGEPFFDSVESRLSSLLFSIPAVKGVEFGSGFELTKLRGSKANDELYIENGEIKTYTNHNGGIQGGLSNGMPIIFKTALKPTPSISKIQRTVDIEKGENVTLKIEGRHDPCIVQRAVPVVESMAAIAILDLLMENNKWKQKN